MPHHIIVHLNRALYRECVHDQQKGFHGTDLLYERLGK